MSLRYSNGAVIKPGFNPVLIPGPPTIGAVTPGSGQVIVAFTAPTDTGGSAITSYQVVSSPGSVVATGASSPITVTGLTNGTAYTFRVAAVNSYGAGTFSSASASATPVTQGQQAYTSPGTYSWVAPAGVTSVSVVAVGAGGNGGRGYGCCGNIPGGAGGGGALAYINNFSTTPGNSYTVVVGTPVSNTSPETSYFNSTGTVAALGGRGSTISGNANAGGTVVAGTGGSGGNGGSKVNNGGGMGGGGAGGYAGAGGNGGNSNNSFCTTTQNGTNGAGGGGAGGSGHSNSAWGGGGGGGVGILGQGASGSIVTRASYCIPATGGGGGSSGNSGTNGNPCSVNKGRAGNGGAYGGGAGGGAPYFCSGYGIGGFGQIGAVRIIWPGTTRQFPSTNTGDL